MNKIELQDISESSFEKSIENAFDINDDILKELQVNIEARLGSAMVSIARLKELKRGDVLELDALVTDPVKLYYKNKFIAVGELVSDGERLGVRIVESVKQK
jgi:flagellar motor switch protein FliN/FliY